MSAIDELKNTPAVELDATGESDSLIIDGTTGNTYEPASSSNTVNMNNIGRKKHTVINPKAAEEKKPTLNVRKAVEINAVAEEEVDTDAHVSPMDDMINPDNPNSMFSKMVERRDAEAREWITEHNEEAAILAEEEEDEDDKSVVKETNVIGDDSDYTPSTNNNIRSQLDDDIDISSIFDDKKENKEEKVDMTPENDVNEIDSMIDSTDLPDSEEVLDEETPEEVEEIINDIKVDDTAEEDTEETKEESTDEKAVIGKVEEDKETSILLDAPDIDITEGDSASFDAVDIEEDDDNVETEVAEEDNEEVLKHLKKLATEKIKPVSTSLDISSFTVLKKPTMNVNPIFQATSARVVKWVLPSQESVVFMKEFSGAELEKLREYTENSRSVDSLNRRFHMIYDHIASPKPATFEQWLKTTPFEDVDHYFFAIYIACFKGANFLPQDCGNDACKETFISNEINAMDMVKFDTQESKDKFAALYQSEATPAGKGIYCTEIVPVTNNIAVQFRQPSIYNIIELATIDNKTRDTYASILGYVPYIDTIYMIDAANKSLVPITYKTFPDNAQRTVRSKIKKYDSIFSAMSVDEFAIIKAYVSALGDTEVGMRYVYPAIECPKCHQMTTEQRVRAEELVFTRYQLGTLVTTSLN